MMTDSQNKEEPTEDDDEGWIMATCRKGRQSNSIQKKSLFHQKHAKGSISHKKKEKINKKMWKSKFIKGKDDDFLDDQ